LSHSLFSGNIGYSRNLRRFLFIMPHLILTWCAHLWTKEHKLYE